VEWTPVALSHSHGKKRATQDTLAGLMSFVEVV
jgi:hypothetical protein